MDSKNSTPLSSSSAARKVTLTFDNGPEPQITPAVLDCLASYGIKSTFFVMGHKAATPQGAALIRRASSEGHWIGNHTYTHTVPLGELDRDSALREFEKTEEALAWLHRPRKLFRPSGSGKLGPHLLHPAIVEKLQAGGYTCVLWNSVPGDWYDPNGWIPRALADARSRDWTLTVLHDRPTGAMAHLSDFIRALLGEGFELVQEFPPDCVPIVDGKIVLPIEPYITTTGS
jgi:peptidoglycan-N-acetylglucosamine deacetylase